MAGLCEGGNEPPGSLKALIEHNRTHHSDAGDIREFDDLVHGPWWIVRDQKGLPRHHQVLETQRSLGDPYYTAFVVPVKKNVS
ncbi:hypothetical protein ANN_00025 [Periplaneta americana]|uniref:Uncharacterized protein n=1 Tax=Periplaneta americana TaxID=6978 RepID=A0ABQ8TTH0_PERAM|nr:hypothetical protein ANN_00025 [Periplaneta americana]